MGPGGDDSKSRAASPKLTVSRTPDSTHWQHPQPRPSHILVEPADRPFPDTIVDALLPESHIRAILRFAEAQGLWQHCCVLFSRFWTELDAFIEAIQGDETWAKVEPTWVALLYTLLGIAVHQMSEQDATTCGLADGEFPAMLDLP